MLRKRCDGRFHKNVSDLSDEAPIGDPTVCTISISLLRIDSNSQCIGVFHPFVLGVELINNEGHRRDANVQ